MRNALGYLFLAAIILGVMVLQHLSLTAAEDKAALWRAEATASRAEAARLQAAVAQARAGQEAASAQAQACLDREGAARAEAAQWQTIFEEMTLRAMSTEELQEVPDDATRRALLSALDEPL